MRGALVFLNGRYQLQDPIARGNGMSIVYRGRDIRMDRDVAIKVLREEYSSDQKLVARFEHEAKAALALALQHPNIVQIYDYGQSDGKYYIVMELVEGTDLRRYLRDRGVLAVDRSIIIAHDVALGLSAIHRRRSVHKRVNPQHVLIGRDGLIKLTAFSTWGGVIVPYYAPEQMQDEMVTPAADVYALGLVMYEMLTGRTPFDGDTPVAIAMQHLHETPIPPSQFNPDIPASMEEVVLRCLEKVPQMRYQDGLQLARALEMLVGEV